MCFLIQVGNGGLRVKKNLLEPECLVSTDKNNRPSVIPVATPTSVITATVSVIGKTNNTDLLKRENITLQNPIGCLRIDPGLIILYSLN